MIRALVEGIMGGSGGQEGLPWGSDFSART